jgi:hypothetical protein
MADTYNERLAKILGNIYYGLRVSKPRHSVYEASRYQLVNTGYPPIKLFQSGTESKVKEINDGGFTITIPHNLGYTPIVYVEGEYFDTPGEVVVHRMSDWNRWIYQGLQVADTYQYYADETNLYIIFNASYLTDDYAFTLKYNYHIFFDEADL